MARDLPSHPDSRSKDPALERAPVTSTSANAPVTFRRWRRQALVDFVHSDQSQPYIRIVDQLVKGLIVDKLLQRVS